MLAAAQAQPSLQPSQSRQLICQVSSHKSQKSCYFYCWLCHNKLRSKFRVVLTGYTVSFWQWGCDDGPLLHPWKRSQWDMLVRIVSNILINLEDIYTHWDEIDRFYENFLWKNMYKKSSRIFTMCGDNNNPYCSSQMYLISYRKAVHFLTSLGNNKQLLFAEDLPCWIVRAAGVRFGRFTSLKKKVMHKHIHTRVTAWIKQWSVQDHCLSPTCKRFQKIVFVQSPRRWVQWHIDLNKQRRLNSDSELSSLLQTKQNWILN